MTKRPNRPGCSHSQPKLTAARRAAGELVAALATGGTASAQLRRCGGGWQGVVNADSRARRGVMEAAREVADFDAAADRQSPAHRLHEILESHAAARGGADASREVLDSLFNEVGEAVELVCRHKEFFDWAVATLMQDQPITPEESHDAFNNPLKLSL